MKILIYYTLISAILASYHSTAQNIIELQPFNRVYAITITTFIQQPGQKLKALPSCLRWPH